MQADQMVLAVSTAGQGCNCNHNIERLLTKKDD